MQLFAVEGNSQRLDGGAMFGNCPRALWERWYAPDEHNRIRLACRALLIRESSGRHVLLETGIGAFLSPALRDRYGVPEADHVLLRSLAAHDVGPADVDVIVLSHLHFDHAGGLLTPWVEGQPPALAFPRARFIVGERSWQRAREPHPRDRASFIEPLQELLRTSGRLEVVPDSAPACATLGECYRFHYSDGHTPGLMSTRVQAADRTITFLGDLVPGTAWVHLPITMGYDRHPELLVDEKRLVLERILAENGWVFYTHDPEVAASRIARDERGRFHAVDERRGPLL